MSIIFPVALPSTEMVSDTPTLNPTTILETPPIGYAETDTSTLGKLKNGSTSIKWVVLIEGIGTVLSDAPQAAVQTALTKTDWSAADVVSGLYVHVKNSQSISPRDAFTSSGSCMLRVIDTSADTFGTLVNRRIPGAETELNATADRDDTTITVKSTTGFDSSGTIYIGNETIAYTGTTATTFTGCTRAKYSPFGTATSGSGGSKFANYHRVGVDPRYIQRAPVVSSRPQTWIGRRVGVWLHTWDGENQVLNSHVNAQLVFAGRIVSITDDPSDFATVVEVEHFQQEWRNAVIGRDFMQADVVRGVYLTTGRKFTFTDWKEGSAQLTANELEVVASGASGTNQINAGYYDGSQICEAINRWLSAEKAASRCYGYYNIAYGVTSNVGLRSKIYWYISDASALTTSFGLGLPGEIAAFLGFTSPEGDPRGQNEQITDSGKPANKERIKQGENVPFQTLVFRPFGPGFAQEFTETILYELDNIRGTFVNQRTFLPSSVRASVDSTKDWGVFLLDERIYVVANYDAGVLKNVFIAPFQPKVKEGDTALGFIGRRLDEPGPVTIRQVFVLEGVLSDILLAMAYSTGTSGYNHSTHDTLGAFLGVGLPGSLLGAEFERSVTNLPGADAPIAVVLDEPKQFGEIIESDFLIRRAFLRWKDEHFQMAAWKTPVAALATVTLTEANKAAPSNQQQDHRSATQETDDWQIQSVKIDYAREFAGSKEAKYTESIQVEDQAATDASAGTTSRRITTLKMANTFSQWQNTGAAVESLIPQYLVTMPMFSRPARKITRSVDLRFFEDVAPGDIAIVTDAFARDPITGSRGITELPAVITRITCDYGGPNPDGSVRPMGGDLELAFLDLQRSNTYAPAAQIDDTANAGGFSGGYNAATSTIRCKGHAFSQSLVIQTKRGPMTISEARDATYFEADDEILIVERDPDDPASVTYWERVVASQTGNDITLTAALSSPAWDSTKKYFIVPQQWASVGANQQDAVFQADDADDLVQDQEPAFHFGATDERYDFTGNDGTERGSYIAAQAYGDGRPWDPAFDRELIATANAFIDRKSAHQNPFLGDTGGGDGTSTWRAVLATMVFFGFESTGESVTRTLTVAPFWRSSDGVSSSVRVTLCQAIPQHQPGAVDQVSTVYRNTRFGSVFAQTSSWTTTSTTWAVGEDKTLNISVKDIFFGTCWLVIEATQSAQVRGLSKCIEGIRTIP